MILLLYHFNKLLILLQPTAEWICAFIRETIDYRDGGYEIIHLFLKYQVCTERGLNIKIKQEALALVLFTLQFCSDSTPLPVNVLTNG